MVGMFGQKVTLGQANGPDVALIVSGTELYATYETPEGYPAIYDDALGLFTYARLVDGRFQSTGIPVTSEPPAGARKHARESDAVRAEKLRERAAQLEGRSQAEREGQQ